MSRILDALKKAEQEKLPQGLSPETPGTEAAPALGNGAQEHAKDHLNGHAAATFQGKAGTRVSNVETLLEACPHPNWNADSVLSLEAGTQRHSLASEEFRSFRSRLNLMRKRQPLQKLLIASSLPKEGKTFIAAHLARTFAEQRGIRVLLIDGDLRLSSLHKILGAPLTPGLSGYLAGEVELNSVLQRGSPDNLFFIPGGEPSENPTELLGNGRFELLINRVSPAFDWIIVDSPPAVPVSDARLLAQFCDGVLMLVHAGVTPFDLAQKACTEFPKGQLLGVVLNRTEPNTGYGYYYGERS